MNEEKIQNANKKAAISTRKSTCETGEPIYHQKIQPLGRSREQYCAVFKEERALVCEREKCERILNGFGVRSIVWKCLRQ